MHPFGNAVGNSIVRNRIEAQLEREKLQAGVAAFLNQKADLIDQQAGALVSAEASKAAGKVLDAVTTENEARFDAMSDALERSNDAMMDQYRNKRAEAAAGLAAMSDKTRGDIAAFDLLVLAGRRRRQEQQSVTAAYYGRKALDFRIENPVYKGSATLLTSQQIQRAQGLIRHDGAVMEMTRRQGELDKVTQELYRAYYGKPGLLLNSEGYTQFSNLNAEIGLAKGALGLGYDAIKNSGIELAYGNLNSMTPKGFLGNALPNDPNFRTLTWGFGMASDVKGQPLFSLSSQALTQPVDIALDTPWARIGNGALTYAGPLVGTAGIIDMGFKDFTNPSYNPTGWDYFSFSSKNAVDWGMARIGAAGPFGALASLTYTAVDYKLSSYEYRPTRPLDGSFDKRTGWHGFGYSLSDSYLNNIEANQRILGPNWKMHGKN